MTEPGSIPTMLAISVPAALIGAASFGLGNAAQQLVARQTPMLHTLDPRLFLRLVRRPLWVLGVLAIVAGVSLQFLALAFGPLILVQPLLVTGLLFAVTFSAWMTHRRVDRVVVLGCLLCVAGLAVSLALARPHDTGPGFVSGDAVLALVVALGTVVTVSLALAGRVRGIVRVLALALATGVLFGVTAGLMKVVGGQVRAGGPAEPLGHWALYLVCVIGPMGFLLSQNTFQQGVGFASALATIRTVDPVVGVAIGVSWLGETVVTAPAVLAGEAIAAATVVVGIVVLARRSSQLRRPAGVG
jgi:drug/metabolite transporter (DMT)-like permease